MIAAPANDRACLGRITEIVTDLVINDDRRSPISPSGSRPRANSPRGSSRCRSGTTSAILPTAPRLPRASRRSAFAVPGRQPELRGYVEPPVMPSATLVSVEA